MADFVKLFVAGLGSGGIYALLALGVVLVYRGSGVVNFAAGGLALLGGAAYYDLRVNESGPKLPTIVAIVVATVICGAVGALIQVAVMRPMRHASPLARVIATLGILSLLREIAVKRYGRIPKFVPSYLPTRFLTFGSVKIGVDRLYYLAIAAAIAGGFWALYRFTRFGLATTGVAENERATAALGWSPSRIATINWALGGALSGLAGVLIVPITSVSPDSLTLTILPALAAALVGGFSSFPITVLGGLMIGVLETESSKYIHQIGASSAVPFLVIIGLLVVRGRAIPLRSHRSERMPKVAAGIVRWPRVAVGFIVALLSLQLFTDTWTVSVTTSVHYGLICLSLVVVTGYCGQLSLAQFALAGLGALFAGRLADAASVPMPLAMLLGVILTIPVGLLVALPAVRVRGVNLAVTTLGLAVVISAVVLANPHYTSGPPKFGVYPGTVLPEPKLFGWSVSEVKHPQRYAVFAMVLLLVAGLMVANMRRGRSGRRLIAVRANERAASSLGISVVGAKLYAFGFGAGLAALGGTVQTFRNTTVQFDDFAIFKSISAVLLAVIGGVGYIVGAVLGGINAPSGAGEQVISALFNVRGWFAVVAGVLLLVIIFLRPNGAASVVAPQWGSLFDAAGRALSRGKRAAASTTAAPATELQAKSQHRVAPKRLEIRSATVRFGSVVAVGDLSMHVDPGEIVGLIGPNGAGKTTLIDIATGFHQHYTGQVILGGVPVDGTSPTKRSRAGLTRSFQSLELFDDLTVEDNLRAASDRRDFGAYLSDIVRPGQSPLSDTAVAAIAEFGLADVLQQYPTDLPYAQRRLVGIARAVATAPSVLLLDEPAAGLDEVSTNELAELIQRLARDWGMGVLLVEHDVQMVLSTCDRVVAINFGEELATGTPEEIRTNEAVVTAYLGASSIGPEPTVTVGASR